jgi:hypothetical protein
MLLQKWNTSFGTAVKTGLSLFIFLLCIRNLLDDGWSGQPIHFILNNQQDALIIQILFCYKTLHVSGVFSTHHQEFSTVQHSQYGTAVPSWLCLEAVIKICMKINSAECIVENSWWWAERMPETCRVYNKKIGIISASGWLFKKKSITIRGHMNVKPKYVALYN